MTSYIRKSRKGNWDSITSETPEDLNFPANVLADILDNENEISVWEIDDPPGPELNYIVAALHSRNVGNLSDVTFRVVSRCKIDQLGLTMRKTTGESLDSSLNKSSRHWVIQTNTVGDAIKLAKALKENDPVIFSQTDVMRAFASSLAAGRIKSDNVGPALVRKLFDDGHLQFVTKQPSGSPDAHTAAG